VRAAGVNPVDGTGPRPGAAAVPCILGYDIAGAARRRGPWGHRPGARRPGDGDDALRGRRFWVRQLAVIDAALVAPIGAATSFAAAAATPLAAGTASLVLARLGLPPGSRLLVLGASGGVGLFVLQLAAAAGFTTIGTGREAMHAQMRGLGAAACIDYTREDVAARARVLADGPVDAIADLVGGSLAQAALPALRPGGQIAAIATPELDLDPLLDANITFHGVLLQDDGDRVRALAGLLDQGELRPVISRRLPLEAAAEAHRILENGHVGGKIVLDVTSSLG
jgi:NADPH2:quinone reductase